MNSWVLPIASSSGRSIAGLTLSAALNWPAGQRRRLAGSLILGYIPPGAHRSDTSKASAVRPGQFLTTLNITQGEMLKPEAGVSDVILTRLEDVRRETLQVLVEMAGG